MLKNARTEWVDYAKAIGIILVVYGHVARGLFNAGLNVNEAIYKMVDSIIYSFHMPLFFFLSGLFFYQSFIKRGAFRLSLNKIDTIVYPYIIWTIIQGGSNIALSKFTNGTTTFFEVFSFWLPYAHFWFLYALFFNFLICILVYSFLPKRFSTVFFGLASVLYLSGKSLPSFPPTYFIADSLVFFLLGIVFSDKALHRYLESRLARITTFTAFVLSQYWFHFYLQQVYSDKGIETLYLAVVSIIFICSLSVTLSAKPNRVMELIGASSMGIYLMHVLAGSGARVILNKFLGIDSVSIHIVLGGLVGIALPLLAIRIIDRLGIPFVFSAPISRVLSRRQ